MKFKNKKTEEKYWRVKSLCSEFIYQWADAKYNEMDLLPLVEKLAVEINPEINIQKAVDKLEGIFKNAYYAFDLPEHEEKHNGYSESHKYENAVMKVFGYDFFGAMEETTNI